MCAANTRGQCSYNLEEEQHSPSISQALCYWRPKQQLQPQKHLPLCCLKYSVYLCSDKYI